MQPPKLMLLAALAPFAFGACYHGGASGGSSGGAIENRTEALRIAPASGDVLAFLPLDADAVIGLDARQALASPLWKHFQDRLLGPVAKHLQEFRAACGYDPFAVVRSVTIAVKVSPNEAVLVVRGAPREKTMACIHRAIPSRRGPVTVERGVVTIPGDEPGEPPVALAFADADTLVIATSRGKLDAALASGAPLRRSRAFAELWQLVDARQALWAVVNGSSSAFQSLSALGVRPRALLGSVHLADGLSLAGRMRLGTPDEATQLASLAQGQLGAVQAMVDKIELAADGADVTLRVDMTTAQVDSLARLVLPMVRP